MFSEKAQQYQFNEMSKFTPEDIKQIVREGLAGKPKTYSDPYSLDQVPEFVKSLDVTRFYSFAQQHVSLGDFSQMLEQLPSFKDTYTKAQKTELIDWYEALLQKEKEKSLKPEKYEGFVPSAPIKKWNYDENLVNSIIEKSVAPMTGPPTAENAVKYGGLDFKSIFDKINGTFTIWFTGPTMQSEVLTYSSVHPDFLNNINNWVQSQAEKYGETNGGSPESKNVVIKAPSDKAPNSTKNHYFYNIGEQLLQHLEANWQIPLITAGVKFWSGVEPESEKIVIISQIGDKSGISKTFDPEDNLLKHRIVDFVKSQIIEKNPTMDYNYTNLEESKQQEYESNLADLPEYTEEPVFDSAKMSNEIFSNPYVQQNLKKMIVNPNTGEITYDKFLKSVNASDHSEAEKKYMLEWGKQYEDWAFKATEAEINESLFGKENEDPYQI
jgi:hypothetical protein